MAHGFTKERLVPPTPHVLTPFIMQTNTTAATRFSATTVTAGAAHTKGTAATLFTATQIIRNLWISANAIGTANTDRSALLDVIYGGTNVVVPNLNVGYAATSATTSAVIGMTYFIPGLTIPAGQTVDVKLQCVTASQTALITAWGDSNLAYGIRNTSGIWTTYGADTANSRGTSVTPGNGAVGSWTQIGTTSSDHDLHIIGFDPLSNTAIVSAFVYIEIGFGPNSGAVTSMGYAFFGETASETAYNVPMVIPYAITSGDILWARVAGGATTAIGILIQSI